MKQEILIPVRNNKTLNSTLYLCDSDGKRGNSIIILCHGFTGDQHEWGRFVTTAEAINAAGFDALTFDFSGSGKNVREEILLSKQVKNLEDIFTWAKNEGYKKFATVGLSFGGLTSLIADLPERSTAVFWAPAFHLKASLSRSRRILIFLVSIFLKNREIKRESKRNLPVIITSRFFKEIFSTDSNNQLSKMKIPILLIQGTQDIDVDPILNYKSFECIPDTIPKKLVKVEGANHAFNNTYLDIFIKNTVEWLQKHL